MLEYSLEAHLDGILAVIDEEISRAADSAYSEDGTPLYDSVVNTERDAETISRLVEDAIRDFASRAYDICKYAPSVIYEQATYGGDPLYYVVDSETSAPTAATTTDVTDYPVYTSKALSTTRILQIYVPDFDVDMTDMAFAEIGRFISLEAVAAFLQQRSAALVPEYTARAQAALAKAVSMLKTRKAPDESWS